MSDEMAAKKKADEAKVAAEAGERIGTPPPPGQPGPEVPHEVQISAVAQTLTKMILESAQTIGDAMVLANMVRDNVQFHAVSSLVWAELSKGGRKQPGKGGGLGWVRQRMSK